MFYKTFLNSGKPKSAQDRVSLCALGKHPGWNDHIEDFGHTSDVLAKLRSFFYVEGVGGLVESAELIKYEEEGNLQEFGHSYLWSRGNQAILGRLWQSSDGVGRTRYPMILACAMNGISLEEGTELALKQLEILENACRETKNAEDVRNLLSSNRICIEELLTKSSTDDDILKSYSPTYSNDFSACNFTDEEIARVYYQLWNLNSGFASKALGANALEGYRGNPHFRVPAGTLESERALLFWTTFFRSQIDPKIPIVVFHNRVTDFCDVILGRPTVSDLLPLRVNLEVFPFTTEVPFGLDDDFKDYCATCNERIKQFDGTEDLSSTSIFRFSEQKRSGAVEDQSAAAQGLSEVKNELKKPLVLTGGIAFIVLLIVITYLVFSGGDDDSEELNSVESAGSASPTQEVYHDGESIYKPNTIEGMSQFSNDNWKWYRYLAVYARRNNAEEWSQDSDLFDYAQRRLVKLEVGKPDVVLEEQEDGSISKSDQSNVRKTFESLWSIREYLSSWPAMGRARKVEARLDEIGWKGDRGDIQENLSEIKFDLSLGRSIASRIEPVSKIDELGKSLESYHQSRQGLGGAHDRLDDTIKANQQLVLSTANFRLLDIELNKQTKANIQLGAFLKESWENEVDLDSLNAGGIAASKGTDSITGWLNLVKKHIKLDADRFEDESEAIRAALVQANEKIDANKEVASPELISESESSLENYQQKYQKWESIHRVAQNEKLIESESSDLLKSIEEEEANLLSGLFSDASKSNIDSRLKDLPLSNRNMAFAWDAFIDNFDRNGSDKNAIDFYRQGSSLNRSINSLESEFLVDAYLSDGNGRGTPDLKEAYKSDLNSIRQHLEESISGQIGNWKPGEEAVIGFMTREVSGFVENVSELNGVYGNFDELRTRFDQFEFDRIDWEFIDELTTEPIPNESKGYHVMKSMLGEALRIKDILHDSDFYELFGVLSRDESIERKVASFKRIQELDGNINIEELNALSTILDELMESIRSISSSVARSLARELEVSYKSIWVGAADSVFGIRDIVSLQKLDRFSASDSYSGGAEVEFYLELLEFLPRLQAIRDDEEAIALKKKFLAMINGKDAYGGSQKIQDSLKSIENFNDDLSNEGDILLDKLGKMGPGSEGWRCELAENGGIVVYSWTGSAHSSPYTLTFRKTFGEQHNSIYVLTDEVSSGSFFDWINEGAGWERFEGLFADWAKDSIDDHFVIGGSSLRGPRSWLLSDGSLISFDYWVSNDSVQGPEIDAFNRKKDNRLAPVQYLGFDAAQAFAVALNCRLLNSGEWSRLLSSDKNLLSSANLKDKSWSDGISSITSNSLTQIGELIGDLFLPSDVDFEKYYASETIPVSADTDGSVWFRESDQGSRKFLNLKGNVAEYVIGEDGKVAVTGGSALSPSEVDWDTFYPIDDAYGEVATRGYSDVGFRICFDAPILTYGERFADFVYSIVVSD